MQRPQQNRSRFRELGLLPGELDTGPINAITDVAGVSVGQVTLNSGGGDHDAIRTGVTVIRPHQGSMFSKKLPAAVHTVNGFGKACGFEQVRELGQLESPICLTNTASVGLAADALISWTIARNPQASSINPLVGECNDGYLNDIRGQHVKKEHVYQALERATTGPVAEGATGAGTGMVCFGLKGGIGTASRRLEPEKGGYTVGALVLANFGKRSLLSMAGLPVGKHLVPLEKELPDPEKDPEQGSIVMVLATDAPLLSRQLLRLAKRAGLGLARTGSFGGHGSGDFVVAFSTQNPIPHKNQEAAITITTLPEQGRILDPLFLAACESVEEAILNALCMAQTTEGIKGRVVHALPLSLVQALAQALPKVGEL